MRKPQAVYKIKVEDKCFVDVLGFFGLMGFLVANSRMAFAEANCLICVGTELDC